MLLTPTSLAFGNVNVGSTSVPQLVQLTNSGITTLNVGGITIIGTDAARYTPFTDTCSNHAIAPNGSCTLQVTFSPDSATTFNNASLDIPSDATSSPDSVPLTGTGVVGPIATTNPTSLDFGTLPPSQGSIPYQVELRNTGNTPLTLSADASLTNNAEFQILTNTCVNGLVLNPGNHCVVVMQYTPPGPGDSSDSDILTFTDDDGGTPASTQTVNLSGEVKQAPSLPATRRMVPIFPLQTPCSEAPFRFESSR